MAFTVNDVRDLVHLLAEHPEWRAELRPLILGDEVLRLPTILQELAEAQRRTEAALASLSARVDELADAQRRTEAALTQLTHRVDHMDRRLSRVEGDTLEIRFERRARSYFGVWLARPRVVELDDLTAFDEAENTGKLSEANVISLRALDLVVRGGDKREEGKPDTVLAVEISSTIDREDVVRADERAGILRSIGLRALGTVGGRSITPRATQLAEERQVLVKVVADD